MGNRPDQYIFLRQRYSHMGNSSGYDLLFKYIEKSKGNCSSVFCQMDEKIPFLKRQILKQQKRKINGGSKYRLSSINPEKETIALAGNFETPIIHIAYAENFYGLLQNQPSNFEGIKIATLHQPPFLLKEINFPIQELNKLDGIILMSSSQKEFLKDKVNIPMEVIPHGIEADFFEPSKDPKKEFRALTSGFHLRDFEGLEKLIAKSRANGDDTIFDLLVPKRVLNDRPIFKKIIQHDGVFFHHDLEELELKKLYQNASALLIPLIDCTANNAILEALASGLPIVTNQVGGISDYVNKETSLISETGDYDGMYQNLIKLKSDKSLQKKLAVNSRERALHSLNWKLMADKTLEFYDRIFNLKFQAN